MNLIIDNPDTDGMSSPAVKEAADRFAEIEKKRAKAMDSSRVIIRMTKNMIHAIHVGEPYDLISTDLHDNVDEFIDALKDEPSVFYSASSKMPCRNMPRHASSPYSSAEGIRRRSIP